MGGPDGPREDSERVGIALERTGQVGQPVFGRGIGRGSRIGDKIAQRTYEDGPRPVFEKFGTQKERDDKIQLYHSLLLLELERFEGSGGVDACIVNDKVHSR